MGFVYTGCFTTAARGARGRGIGIYADGPDWALAGALDGLTNPSYLLKHPSLPVLYAAHGDETYVSVFAIDGSTGALTPAGQATVNGNNGVHIALTPDARRLVVANYGSGTLALLPVGADGALGAALATLALPGATGPHRTDQTGAHPHQAMFDPSGRFLIVPDKGLDLVFVLTIDDDKFGIVSETPMRPAAGPRHGVWHPGGSTLFVVNELDSTVATLGWNGAGHLTPLHVTSTLPSDFFGASTAAAIVITPDGRFVYTSNRGQDSIAAFAFAAEPARLVAIDHVPARGSGPRFMTLSPDGRQLLVAHEHSDRIVAFSIEPHGGALTPASLEVATPSPVSIAFA
jgi:6-phosphogluconolactonase (cycloisomerase 2 family)